MRNCVLNFKLRSLVGSAESWSVFEQESDHRVCTAGALSSAMNEWEERKR